MASVETEHSGPCPNPGLLQRLSSWEHSLHSLLSSKKRATSQQHLLHLEKQLQTCSSPRIRSKPNGAISPSPSPSAFQVPLHYPRYSKTDYESMPEWQLDHLLLEYGLPQPASLEEKRSTAIGTFLWRD